MSMQRKMERHDVLTVVIPQLQALYSPPTPPKLPGGEDNPAFAALLELYANDLTGFTTAQYERGMADFRKDWTYRRWPTIGELLRYFDAQKMRDTEALPPAEEPEEKPIWGSYAANPEGYVAKTERLRAERDQEDIAAGRKPLGKPASQATKQEIAAYWAQFPERPKLGG